MSLRINLEYEKLLPRMSDEEYEELKASIKSEGQHYPIVANEDLEVLDGHHRFKACIDLGIEPDFEVRKFDNKLIEKKFVIEANLRRRHLNSFQLIELGAPLLEIERALAKKRQSEGGTIGRNLQLGVAPDDAKPISKKKAADVVAKKIGVSTRTFERGMKILNEGSEESKQRLREGKVSISRIYGEIVTPKTKIEEKPEHFDGMIELKSSDQIDRKLENLKLLSNILQDLQEKRIFCPSCGNPMLECSKCHRSLLETVDSSGFVSKDEEE